MMLPVRERLLSIDRKLEVYMSSILVRNQDVPLFEEYFGQLDFDWLLRLSSKKWHIIDTSTVKRYVDGKNLSLNPEYRSRDFHMALLFVEDNLQSMKKLNGSRARYYYQIGRYKTARYYFKQSNLTIKNILYYLTSYIPFIADKIKKKFRVFG